MLLFGSFVFAHNLDSLVKTNNHRSDVHQQTHTFSVQTPLPSGSHFSCIHFFCIQNWCRQTFFFLALSTFPLQAITMCISIKLSIFHRKINANSKETAHSNYFKVSAFWFYTFYPHLSFNLWIHPQKKSLSFDANHSSTHFVTSAKCCSARTWLIELARL